jgi:hypothetical protein
MKDALRHRELAKIHVGKKALGLDDGTYRALLLAVTGRESAADLDGPQRRRVIEAMKRDGAFQGVNDPWRAVKAAIPAHRRDGESDQQALIRAAWRWLGENGALRDPWWACDAGIDRFCRRVTGIATLRWLPPGAANKVVEALKAMIRRHGNACPPRVVPSGAPPRHAGSEAE